ncbi:MAG: enoyl-CoA hydratase/isomerase family protein [Pseudomonadales bacterium]|nr:enoyl-CoA hydratase/isomerase family protein [Pseudomonadales bacterium]
MPILHNQENHISTLTINRPPANTMTQLAFEKLNTLLDELEEDKNTRVIIITGQGEKGFCAGFDLSEAANSGTVHQLAQQICNKIAAYPKPIIAAINGYALGGGCEIAMSCHIRMMINSPKAIIGLPESNLGVLPVWGGTQRLPKLVGKAKAIEMMAFSDKISGEKALEIGLIDHLFSSENFQNDVKKFTQRLSKRPPLAVSSILKSIYAGEQHGLEEGLKTELEEVVKLGSTKDAMEGIQAFFQKREPLFTGE